MRIVVNLRWLGKSEWDDRSYFSYALMKQVIKQHPEHEFLLLSDKHVLGYFRPEKNVVIETLTPVIKGSLSLKYWYDVKLNAAVKNASADVLINFDNACSLTTKIPQVFLIIGLGQIDYKKSIFGFQKSLQKKYIQTAKRIVVASEYLKQEVIDQYKAEVGKISVISIATENKVAPVSFEKRESIKLEYAEGKEYFLFAGDINESNYLMNVLRAFSIFKKWQKSSMKLLISGKGNEKLDWLIEKLQTYKYKDDVVVLDELQLEDSNILYGAYAVIYSSITLLGLPIIASMKSAVPVIANNHPSIVEMGNAALMYMNPNDVDEIANQMKLLYRDENLRSQLIQKGLVQAEKFSWDTSAEKFMAIIEAAASK